MEQYGSIENRVACAGGAGRGALVGERGRAGARRGGAAPRSPPPAVAEEEGEEEGEGDREKKTSSQWGSGGRSQRDWENSRG